MLGPIFKANENYVIIKLDDDVLADPNNGLEIPRFLEEEKSLVIPVTGTIVSACSKVFFDRSAGRACAQFNVPVEVSPGDHVLFEWLALEKHDLFIDESTLVVRYDQLILRTKDLYPLNGYVLLDMHDENIVGADYGRSLFNCNMDVATVINQGCLVADYLYWPDEKDELLDLKQKVVLLSRNSATRAELPEITTVKNGRPYFYTSQRNILGTVEPR